MYSSIAAAAVLPAPIARITVAAPVTASPPAYTPSRDVRPCSSVIMPPHFCVSRPFVVALISGFGDVPIEITTASTSSTNSLPGLTTGLHLPLSSGSPSSISTHFIPVTNSFSSPRISTGLLRSLKIMPSSLACSTSSLLAGSSSSLLL